MLLPVAGTLPVDVLGATTRRGEPYPVRQRFEADEKLQYYPTLYPTQHFFTLDFPAQSSPRLCVSAAKRGLHKQEEEEPERGSLSEVPVAGDIQI